MCMESRGQIQVSFFDDSVLLKSFSLNLEVID